MVVGKADQGGATEVGKGMSPMYDYRCDAGHTTEKYSQIVRDHIPCECGRKAYRLSVYPISSKPFIWPSNTNAS